jgi:hypothetical protein
MNGLLNETVVRVVLMVMMKSPGQTCIAGCQVTDLARRTSLERLLNAIGYLPRLLSKIAQTRQQSGRQLVVNVTPLKRPPT